MLLSALAGRLSSAGLRTGCFSLADTVAVMSRRSGRELSSLVVDGGRPVSVRRRPLLRLLSDASGTSPPSSAAAAAAAPKRRTGDVNQVKALADAKMLEEIGISRQELFYYLNNYRSVHGQAFAVIKVGGAIIEEELDQLVSAIGLMRQLDLMPVIVHGAGPQMNAVLQKEGIVSNYVNGLRVTSPRILQVARQVFAEQNYKLVNALEAVGVRARPVQQGVFEATPIDIATVGLVGDVSAVDLGPVQASIEAGCVPVLTCMGQDKNGQLLNINADMAARELSLAVKPTKVVYLSGKGGLLDDSGNVISQINLSDDYDMLMSQPWFKHGDRLKLREVKSVLEGLPFSSSVSIVSTAMLSQELFTHAGSGTNIQDQEKLNEYSSLDMVDIPRLRTLIEAAFDEHLADDYFEQIRDSVETIFISEHYRAAAVITDLSKGREAEFAALPGGTDVRYLDKFAVLQQFQSQGVGKRLWQRMTNKYQRLVWRTRLSNPIAAWYFDLADGTMANDRWTVFWTGIASFPLIEKYVTELFNKPGSFSPVPRPDPCAPVRLVDVPEPAKKFSLGLIGARGYTGGEFLELLENHPNIELRLASSRQFEGRQLSEVMPHLNIEKLGDIVISNLSPDDCAAVGDDVDMWVLALPNDSAPPYVKALGKSSKIIDLSSDHRFTPDWAYGLPESRGQRQVIRTSNRVANPGCYATGAQLSLLPLLRDPNRTSGSVIRGPPLIAGVSGYSGAGTTPSPRNDTVRLADNLMAYGLNGHIHEREIGHHLAPYGLKYGVDFVPHVASWFRGIHLTIVCHLTIPLDRQELVDRYLTYYKDEPLIRVTTEIPEVKDVNRSNLVHIGGFGVSPKHDRVVIVSTIDNLRKGAASQALQNINLMLGLPEYEGVSIE